MTDGNAVMVEVPALGWVTVDAALLGRALAHALRIAVLGRAAAGPVLAALRAELGPYAEVREEIRLGRHRFDIGLYGDSEAQHSFLLEVKSVTLARDGVGLFPDAPTGRGAEHVRVLGELAAQGRRAGLVFAAGRRDAAVVRPHAELDPRFAANLRAAVGAGLRVMAVFLEASPSGIRVARRVPVDLS